MKVVGVVPARMASSRFPGKPLAQIAGMTMLEHVYRRCLMSRCLDDVYIATCDESIRRAVLDFGGKAVMTSDEHTRCTDRVAEAAREMDADVVVNIQGDEPLLRPETVDFVAEPIVQESGVVCTTIVVKITNERELDDPNVVKTVSRPNGDILYFSRELIPSRRMGAAHDVFKQIGVLAFTREFLLQFDELPETPLEVAESVDLLRALEHGYTVRGVLSPFDTIGVDTPDDRRRVEELMTRDEIYPRYVKTK
jgi:3-deoxy-manno-octulosonate cytidylyltransferase (CMP-KDO synthetase)